MSTLTFVTDAELAAGNSFTDDVALELWWSNPEAVLDLVYGSSRRLIGTAPPHDHDEDGGEPAYRPILQRSFGRYFQNLGGRGIPIGPPVSGTFVPTEDNGYTDRSQCKRLDCVGVLLPGGCTRVRLSLTEYHEVAGGTVTLLVALRSLNSVNYQLGYGLDEVIAELEYTTVGATTTGVVSVDLTDLTDLGDPGLDRLVEASLWLACDLNATDEHRLLDWEILPTAFAATREANVSDLAYPALAPRELKAGLGIISPELIAKVKEIYNALNRGLWGSTPGLSPQTLQPDPRRRYRETITDWHQHQGAQCPDGAGGIFGDGACPTDAQSFAFLMFMGETLPLVAATPPTMDHRPNRGTYLHATDDLSQGWLHYRFRRSIPAGCGELRLRLGAHPGFEYSAPSFDTSQRLLVSVEVVPVGGGSSIVTRLLCGPYASPLDPSETNYGYVEIEPEEDVAYLSNGALSGQNKKGWNRGAEISPTEQAALHLNSVTYRVSQEIRVLLSYPPQRPSETYHATGDYEVRLRCKMINSANLADDEAGLLWLCCWTPKGY